jgi:1-acyl-sn-glycerol-3-phosphate acyltransferase
MSKTPLLISIIRPTYGKWLLRHYNVSTLNFDQIPKQGPFLVLGNHTHIYDAFFISSAFTQHINWVAGAYLFKNKALNYILGTLIGGIAKQQGKSDLHTITQIRNSLRKREIVGLFPEGTRTWDGESIPINDATAKLVRIFNVPVVIIQVDGGYGSRPRWSKVRRKGPIVLNVVKVVTPSEIEGKKVKEIASLINKSLVYSYENWQKENSVPFTSPIRSEGIEKLLYACPKCNSISTIKGSEDKIHCSSCSAVWTLDDFDKLHPHQEGNLPGSVSQWHKWEIEFVEKLSQNSKSGELIFPVDKGTLFQIAKGKRLRVLSKDFTFETHCNKFILRVNSFKRKIDSVVGKVVEFYFDDIISIAINAKNTLEFTYKERIYRVRIEEGKSILKYMELFQNNKCESLKESI